MHSLVYSLAWPDHFLLAGSAERLLEVDLTKQQIYLFQSNCTKNLQTHICFYNTTGRTF